MQTQSVITINKQLFRVARVRLAKTILNPLRKISSGYLFIALQQRLRHDTATGKSSASLISPLTSEKPHARKRSIRHQYQKLVHQSKEENRGEVIWSAESMTLRAGFNANAPPHKNISLVFRQCGINSETYKST